MLDRDCLDLTAEAEEKGEPNQTSRERLSRITAAAEQLLATTVVVAAPPQLLGLTISVPPAKEEDQAKAIALLLEDTLPFAAEEFLFDWHPLGGGGSTPVDGGAVSPRALNQFQVSGAPHRFVQDTIDWCRTLGIEPHRICPPAAALGGVLPRLPDSDAPVIVLYATPEGLHQLVGIGGNPSFQRFVPFDRSTEGSNGVMPVITRETLALCLWAKRQMGREVGVVYTVQPLPSLQLPSIPVEPLPLSQEESSLADMAARACLDHDMQPLVTNFRTGDLAIHPLIQRAIQFLPAFAKALGSGLLAIALLLGVLWVVRERQISQVEAELSQQIQALLPGKPVVPGGEVQALKNENTTLNRQLSDLSSAVTISPIDALSTIFRDLPDSKTISLTSLELIGKAIRLKGLSQDYAEIEKLESYLRKRQTKSRKQVYCRIKKELPPSGRSDRVAFRFELRICNVD